MRLVSDLVGFLLRKAGLLGATLVSLFLVYLLVQAAVPALRDAVTDRDRLDEVTRERAAIEEDLERLKSVAVADRLEVIAALEARIDAAVQEGRRGVSQDKDELEEARAQERDDCQFRDKVVEFFTTVNPCEDAKLAVARARDALDAVEGSLEEAEQAAGVLADPDLTAQQKLDRLGEGGVESLVDREIATKEAELAQTRAEQESLERAHASWAGWVVDQWVRSWRWLAGIAVIVLLLPPVLRTVSYFVLMPLVHRWHTPIRLSADAEGGTTNLRTTEAQRTIRVDLGPDDVLSARSEYVRPVQGRARSRLLYDWSAPFISYAAGLSSLSRITGDEQIASATLASPDNPDAYLMRIDFRNHPGLVVHPKHVVGVIGSPGLETRWRWGVAPFATWQVRYIMFTGAGALIVQGVGDVVATNPGGKSTRMEQNLVMGFDSRLARGVNRTEVFWPYLLGRTSLVDDEFTGGHPLFWQKSTTEGPKSPIARSFDAVFSAVGKLLGF